MERGGEGWRGERGTEERMERMRGGREEDRESRTGPWGQDAMFSKNQHGILLYHPLVTGISLSRCHLDKDYP
jgi:hypothetical protein